MTAERSFTDVMGAVWVVWEVYPTLVERRLLAERRAARRDAIDRRHEKSGRPTLPLQIRGGWLAFQSKFERRRLIPVPDEWEVLDDVALRHLLAQSRLASRPRGVAR